MTDGVPALGLYRTPDHWYYYNGHGPFPGTTGALDVIAKPALVEWAKRTTADAAIADVDLLAGLIRTGGADVARQWLRRAADVQRDRAAARGTRIHAAADALYRGEPIDVEPEELPSVDAFAGFLERRVRRVLASELGVIGSTPAGRYGGTPDLIAELDDGRVWLLDLKTSKGTYPETALQLAAYGFADFGAYPGDPRAYALPAIDAFGVVHIRPELYTDAAELGYRLIPYEVTPDTFATFGAALRLAQWTRAAKGART